MSRVQLFVAKRALIMAAAILAPEECSTHPSAPEARASQERTVGCILAHSVPQFGEALALDRGRGHARYRHGRGALLGPLLANAVPDCGSRLRFIIRAFIAAGSMKEDQGRARDEVAESGTAVLLLSM